MRIYKRDGVWYFDGRDAGLGRYSLKTKFKKIAEDYLKKIEYEHTTGILELPKTLKKEKEITLSDGIEQFLDYCKGQIKESTINRYELSKKNIINYFGNKLIQELKPLEIEKYKNGQLCAGKAKATINRDLQFLKAMLNKLIKWEIIETNIMNKISLFQEDNIRTRILSFEEIRKLLKVIDEHQRMVETKKLKNKQKNEIINDIKKGLKNSVIANIYGISESTVIYYKKRYKEEREFTKQEEDFKYLKMIVLIALHTGMRKNEIMSLYYMDNEDVFNFSAKAEKLKMNWIDLRRRIIIINNSKNNRSRLIPINEYLLSEIEKYVKERKEGLLFDIKDPKRSFNTACKKAGLEDITFHDLRRTFISQMAMDGHSRELIQSIVGQVSESVYKRYAHFSNMAKMNAVNSYGTKLAQMPEVINLYRVAEGKNNL